MKQDLMWGYLLHLGYNMWNDVSWHTEYGGASDTLRCDVKLWDELVRFMAKSGINTCVIDLGEGLQYESHPELAVKRSWSAEFLKKKLVRMRDAGITPIPKLNFSTGHDQWMGEYARAVSTRWYYDFCKEIIDEVVDIFDKPPLFHIGMDEENYHNQQDYSHVVVRQNDLWWHDFYYLVDLVEKNKSRAWIWSDFIWDNPEVFLRKMPQSVLQSNWYYGRFTPSELDSMGIKSYSILEENGYDQVPTGSNWECSENFGRTVEFGASSIGLERLKGFLQTSWKPTLIERKYRHLEAIDVVAQAKRRYYL